MIRGLVVSMIALAPFTAGQWRGPTRDGVVPAITPTPNWPPQLSKLWERDVGQGLSGPVVDSRRVCVLTRRGANETVSCLRLDTGAQPWTAPPALPSSNRIMMPPSTAAAPSPRRPTPTTASSPSASTASAPPGTRPPAVSSGSGSRTANSISLTLTSAPQPLPLPLPSSGAAWFSSIPAGTAAARWSHPEPEPSSPFAFPTAANSGASLTWCLWTTPSPRRSASRTASSPPTTTLASCPGASGEHA